MRMKVLMRQSGEGATMKSLRKTGEVGDMNSQRKSGGGMAMSTGMSTGMSMAMTMVMTTVMIMDTTVMATGRRKRMIEEGMLATNMLSLKTSPGK